MKSSKFNCAFTGAMLKAKEVETIRIGSIRKMNLHLLTWMTKLL